MKEQTSGLGQPAIQRRRLLEEQERQRRLQHQQIASPHRVGHSAGLHPEDQPYLTGQHVRQQVIQRHGTANITRGQVIDRDEEAEEEDDYVYSNRLPSSAMRYQVAPDGQVIHQGNRRIVVHYGPPPPHYEQWHEKRPQRASPVRFHWLVFVGCAMFLLIIGWVALNALGNWWQVTQDDWHYGRPRTFQIDAVVGHNDAPGSPSHFIAMNLNRHVLVIECPAGDCTKAVIYSGPVLIGDGQDLTPVTISFKDVNGDDRLDLLEHVLDQTLVFINDGGKFRPAKPGEQITL